MHFIFQRKELQQDKKNLELNRREWNPEPRGMFF